MPLTVSSIPITVTQNQSGADLEFSETDTCGINPSPAPNPTPTPMVPLPPFKNCVISITFNPTAGLGQFAALTITSDYPGLQPAVELIGYAPATPAPPTPTPTPGGVSLIPAPRLVPGNVPFGPVLIGASSSPQTITLTNVSNTDTLNITGYNVVPASGPFAAISPAPPTDCAGAMVPPEGQCTVTLQFSPLGPGSQIGSLSFSDNAASGPFHPQTVGLSGFGVFFAPPTPTPAPGELPPPPSIIPLSINFGPVLVGNTSPAVNITVVNNSNFFPLIFPSTGDVTVTGAFATTVDTCAGVDLPPFQTCTVGVTFSPTTNGGQAGNLKFSDNALNSVLGGQTVTLYGSGFTPVPTPASTP